MCNADSEGLVLMAESEKQAFSGRQSYMQVVYSISTPSWARQMIFFLLKRLDFEDEM